MKKLSISIISVAIVFIVVFTFNVYANDMDGSAVNNELYGSSEAVEIQTDMEIIVDGIDSFGIIQDDVDLNRVVRVYPEIDIFSEEIKSPDEMKNKLDGMVYVYVLPIDTAESSYTVTVSKLDEVNDYTGLDEEDIKYLEKILGRWCTAVIIPYDEGPDDTFQDYKKKVNTFFDYYGIEESETFFIGGTTTNSVTIAVCFPEDSTQGAYYIAMDEFPLNPQNIEDIQGAVYTFEEMKEYAIDFTPYEYETENGSDGETIYYGGIVSRSASARNTTSPWLYIIIAVIVCAAVAVTVIVVRKHRSKA